MTHSPTVLDENQLIQALKAASLRLTPQRLAVYRYLTSVATHPTAQQVFEALSPEHPSLSLATVYNTLETLVGLGVVNALGSAGDDAMHYDGDVSPHVNLACIHCHRVIDLPSEHVFALKEEVSQNSGYHLMGARVLYYGLCPACQTRQGETHAAA